MYCTVLYSTNRYGTNWQSRARDNTDQNIAAYCIVALFAVATPFTVDT